MRLLPIAFPPLPGESLDSWFLAYAARLNTPVGDLADAVGIGSPFMRQPVAKIALGHRLSATASLSEATGIPVEAVAALGSRCPATPWSSGAVSERVASPGQPGRCRGADSARRVWPSREGDGLPRGGCRSSSPAQPTSVSCLWCARAAANSSDG